MEQATWRSLILGYNSAALQQILADRLAITTSANTSEVGA